MSLRRGGGAVVHGDASDLTRIERKTAGLDNVHLGPEAGGGANRRAHILGDVGLIQGKAHKSVFARNSGPVAMPQRR